MQGKEQIFYPEEEIGSDIVHIKENMGGVYPLANYLYKNRGFQALQFIPLVILFLFTYLLRRQEKMQNDSGYARAVKAPKEARKGLLAAKKVLAKGDSQKFYDTIFKTIQSYFASRLKMPAGSITIQTVTERLKSAGCDEKTLDMLKDVFSNCEMARYASFYPSSMEAMEIMEKVRRITSHVERLKL